MGICFLYDTTEQRREVASLVERLMRETLGDEAAQRLIGARAE